MNAFVDEEFFCLHWNNSRIEKCCNGEVDENSKRIEHQSSTLLNSSKYVL